MYVYAACMLVITRRVQATGIYRLLQRATESTALSGVVGRGGTAILALWRPLLQFSRRSHLTYSTLASTPAFSDKQVPSLLLDTCLVLVSCGPPSHPSSHSYDAQRFTSFISSS